MHSGDWERQEKSVPNLPYLESKLRRETYAPSTSHAVSLGPTSHPRYICGSGLDTDRNQKIQVEGTVAAYRPPQQGARPPLFELGCK